MGRAGSQMEMRQQKGPVWLRKWAATRCHGDDRTVNLDRPSHLLSQRLTTAWERGLDPSKQGRATGFMWLKRRRSGARWGMTSLPLVVLPIAPHFSMACRSALASLLPFAESSYKAATGVRLLQDPDFALRQASQQRSPACLPRAACRRLGVAAHLQSYERRRGPARCGVTSELPPSA